MTGLDQHVECRLGVTKDLGYSACVDSRRGYFGHTDGTRRLGTIPFVEAVLLSMCFLCKRKEKNPSPTVVSSSKDTQNLDNPSTKKKRTYSICAVGVDRVAQYS